MIPIIWYSIKGKTIEMVNRAVFVNCFGNEKRVQWVKHSRVFTAVKLPYDTVIVGT